MILCETEKWSIGVNWCHFPICILHKAAKSMINLTSKSCGYLQWALWLSKGMGPFRSYPSTCGHLTGLRNKPQQKQHKTLSAPIAALAVIYIVNVYSYCVCRVVVQLCNSQLLSIHSCVIKSCTEVQQAFSYFQCIKSKHRQWHRCILVLLLQ